MKITLQTPDETMLADIAAYRADMLAAGSSMDGTGPLRRFEDPRAWLEERRRGQFEETCPEGFVPATQLVALDETGRIVGMLDIRHRFNDYLARYAGNIGYSVRPCARRQGVAAEMLRQALPLAKEIGLERVLITCLEDNEGSRRTILKNGGVYESTVVETETKTGVPERLQRYWIDLA